MAKSAADFSVAPLDPAILADAMASLSKKSLERSLRSP
jgi:hypothetical protein